TDPPEASPTETERPLAPQPPGVGQKGGDDVKQPEASAPSEAHVAHGVTEPGSFRLAPGADRKLPPHGNPCAAGALETLEASGSFSLQTPPEPSARGAE